MGCSHSVNSLYDKDQLRCMHAFDFFTPRAAVRSLDSTFPNSRTITSTIEVPGVELPQTTQNLFLTRSCKITLYANAFFLQDLLFQQVSCKINIFRAIWPDFYVYVMFISYVKIISYEIFAKPLLMQDVLQEIH